MIKRYIKKKLIHINHLNLIMAELVILLVLVLTTLLANSYFNKKQNLLAVKQEGSVLGTVSTEISPTIFVVPISTPTPTPTPTITPTIIPSPTPTPKKQEYTIAIIGDSIVDTMGENIEFLQKSLNKKYPKTTFKLYNYGIGSQNIEDGLNRLSQEFSYKTRSYPSIPYLNPDILIIASFAYNPFSPHNPKKHEKILTSLVEKAKSLSDEIYMLAEIAPIKRDFGKGPKGVNWKDDDAYEHATNIIEQLENVMSVSEKLEVPLIDAFEPSQFNWEKEGKKYLITSKDGIHPSKEGHEFMADIIAHELKL